MRNNLWAIVISRCSLLILVLLLLSLKGAGAGEKYPPQAVRELTNMHYNRAREYFRSGQYKDAELEFKEVLRLQPRHQGALWYLKLVEKELAKYKKTFRGHLENLRKQKLTKKEREQDMRGEAVKDALDLIEQRGKDITLARDEQEPPHEMQEKTIDLLHKTTAGLIEEQQEQKDLQQIIELYEQGKAYLEQGLYSEAIACFDKVIELGGEP